MSSLRHLRSSTAAKRPTASGIADGQLAINTASGTPGLFFKDNASGIVKIGPAHVGATAPNATPAGSSGHTTGEQWLDTATAPSGLKVWDGSDWFTVNPSGTTTTLGVVQFATVAETQSGVTGTKAVTPSGLQSKLSDSISTTSSTSIASSTAVKTAYDLANSAIQASGGVMTGPLEIGPSGSIIFEGSGVNTLETTISVIDPTADRTILFPDVSGTVVTTGDNGTITGTMISGLTITNANISTSAAITDGKLATISGVDKVSLSALNIDGATDINAAIVDADLLIIDDGGAGANRKTNVSRIPTYVFAKASGDATISAGGVVALSSGVIVDGDINASAAIGLSKLAPGALPTGITVSSGNIVDGTISNAEINASAAIDLSKLATGALPTGITVTRGNITSPALVNADIASDAAIAHSKLASITAGNVLLGNASGVATSTALSGDVTITSAGVTAIAAGVIADGDISGSAAIGLSKLAPGALPTGITISSGNIVDGTISNVDINASAAIALSKLAPGALPSGITVGTSNIVDLTITNSDISASAAIEVSKINSDNLNAINGITASGIIAKTGASTAAARTIVASGVGLSISNGNGVSGNPTISSNATDANTASTIVARDANGNFNTASINDGPLAGMRNRIINGDMRIYQRGVAATVNAAYSIDRWLLGIAGAGAVSVSQSTTVPTVATSSTKFTKSLLFDVTTADATVDASDFYTVSQYVEGFNSADFGFGATGAETITISFWARSSTIGTYGFSLINGATNRSYVSEYTINSANTWEKKTITIAGDTTGTWATDNTTGLHCRWTFSAGTTYRTTAGTWQAGNFLTTANQTNLMALSTNDFYITGVQLEPGPVATPFEHRSIGTELALCQRYFQLHQGIAGGVTSSGVGMYGMISYQVAMRANPNHVFSNVSVIGGFDATNPAIASVANNVEFSFVKTATATGGGIYSFDVSVSSEL